MARRTSWGSRGGGHGASGDAERPLSARERVNQRLYSSSGTDPQRFERAVEGLGEVAARRSGDTVSQMLSELREQIHELTQDRPPVETGRSANLADDIRSLIRELEHRGVRRRSDLEEERESAIEALEQFKSQITAMAGDGRTGRRSRADLPALEDLEQAVSRIARRQDEIERRSHPPDDDLEAGGRLERLGRKLEELRGRPADDEGDDPVGREFRGLRGQIAELKDQIDQLGEAYPDLVEAMDEKLDDIAKRFSNLDETPDTLMAMERSYRDVAEQLARLADQSEHVGEIRAKLADIREKLDSAPSADSVRSLEERILDLARRLEALGTRGERGGDERLTQIEKQLAEIARALAPLKAASTSSLEAGLAAIANFVAEPEPREPDVLRALDDQIDRLAEGIAASLRTQKADSVASIERRLDALSEQIDASAGGAATDLAPLENRLHVITEQIDRLGSAAGEDDSIRTFGDLLVRFESALDGMAGKSSDAAFDQRIDRLVETVEKLAARTEGSDLSTILEEIASVRQVVAAPSAPADEEFRALLTSVSEQLERFGSIEPVTPALLDEQVVRLLEAIETGNAGDRTADRIERALQTLESQMAGPGLASTQSGSDANQARILDTAALENLISSLRDDLTALRTMTELSSQETRQTLEEVQRALHAAAPRAAGPSGAAVQGPAPADADAPGRAPATSTDRDPAARLDPAARSSSPTSTADGHQTRRGTMTPSRRDRPEATAHPVEDKLEGSSAPKSDMRGQAAPERPRPPSEEPADAPRKGTSAEALRRFATLQAKSGVRDERDQTVDGKTVAEPSEGPQAKDSPSERAEAAAAGTRAEARERQVAAPGDTDAVTKTAEGAGGRSGAQTAAPPKGDPSVVSLDQPTDPEEKSGRRGLLSRLTGKGNSSNEPSSMQRPGAADLGAPTDSDARADRVQRAVSGSPATGGQSKRPPAEGGAVLESDDPAVQTMLRQMRAAKTPSQSTFLANARRAAQAASIQAMEAERIEKETKHPSPIVRAVGKFRSKKVILLALFLGGAGGMLATTHDDPSLSVRSLAGRLIDKTGVADFASRRQETGPRFGDGRVSLLVDVAAAPSAPPHPGRNVFSPDRDGDGLLNSDSRVAAAQTLDLLALPIAVGPPELRDAARAGVAAAQFEVGARLASNLYTTRDLPAAIAWYARAAAAGYPDALYRLGAMYENGVGVKADRNRALEFYLAAAERGQRVAMHNLGVMLAGGAGDGRPDMKESLRWFRKAAQRGVRDSQYNLGLIYARGLGVKKDPVEAYKWFAIAARADDEAAAGRRDAIAAKLRRSQLAQARQAVAAFEPLSAEEASGGEDTAAGWLGARSEQPIPDLSARGPVSSDRIGGRKS